MKLKFNYLLFIIIIINYDYAICYVYKKYSNYCTYPHDLGCDYGRSLDWQMDLLTT
jgi:hypothetical protein